MKKEQFKKVNYLYSILPGWEGADHSAFNNITLGTSKLSYNAERKLIQRITSSCLSNATQRRLEFLEYLNALIPFST